jgi:hypothetical protein
MVNCDGMTKVYLETSFFSLCVTARTDPLDVGRRVSSSLWWQTQASHFDLFISPEVVRELSAPEFPSSTHALAMLQGLNVLEVTPEVIDLADLLVHEKVMPGPSVEGDAIHVAAATIHRMDYLLTWNVKHLANPNKRTHFAVICMRLGLAAPQLVTPDLLQESENE